MLFRSTTDGHLWLISTPNGPSGFFYDEWIAENSRFTKIRVPATECPRISAAFLAEIRTRTPLSDFGQEYLCEFLSPADAMFPRDILDAADADPAILPLFPERLLLQ